jgi:hypothetical protein
MMKSSGAPVLVIALATVVTVFALAPASGKPGQKKKTVQPLGAYGIDIRQTSVSGVSSGGAMAVQMHVAHSSIMRGAGVIAGVTYDCVNSSLVTSALRLVQGRQDSRRCGRSRCHRRSRGESSPAKGVVVFRV